MPDEIADGITMLRRYGQYRTACWVLQNNGEAAVVEMPPFLGGEKPPFEKAATFLKKNRLHLKYAFISHPHWDHCHTLPWFRDRFPQTIFVGHESFMLDSYFRFMIRNVRIVRADGYVMGGNSIFDVMLEDDFWAGDIGGEPIYVIHAPKHSYSDLLIVFKGAMITGDWFIGDLKDCNALVRSADKVRSINRAMEIIGSLGYNVHMLFSAHGDCLFYDADFFSVMEQSKVNHRGSHPNIKATYVPGGRKRRRSNARR
jgi:glyoxylase-like metal-dependent hydrolase (beta-lactamase superfamily II)